MKLEWRPAAALVIDTSTIRLRYNYVIQGPSARILGTINNQSASVFSAEEQCRSKRACLAIMVEGIEEKILSLHSERNWEDIVNLDCTLNEFAKCRLFWVLPTIDDLRWMKRVIDEHNVVGLASIGCGCGLLEWLFKEYSGLDVIGIELDRSWWRSKYSPPLFIENVLFVRDDSTKDFCIPENYALLFCYFNNASAFCDYIESYKGRLILIIGPKEGEDRWTEPMPFDKKFNEYGWKLLNEREIERTNDYITVYGR